MASISDLPGGRRKIQFTDSASKRQTVYLGKVTHRNSEGWKLRVEQLAIAQRLGQQPEDDVAKWLSKLNDRMHAKLAKAGLATARAASAIEATTLGPWVERYISGRADAKPTTVTVWRRGQKHLLAHFGAKRTLASITTADAIEFRLWLLTDQKDVAGKVTRRALADNTVRKTIAVAKQFLQRAVRSRLILDNPFRDDDLPTRTTVNKSREWFVTRAEAEKVLDSCPDPEWRLIFALSRYGGLRCPSEHFGLRWSDVDWSRGRITVHAPKTEHHAGHGVRVVPIFPELRAHLQAMYDAAPEGSEWIITRRLLAKTNTRNGMFRILKRAGLTPWPKLFHNLRASRQTELAATFPIHVVCAWLGNSPAIAMAHYLQVTDADFDRASECERNCEHPVQSPSVLERPGVNAICRKTPRNSQSPVKTRSIAGTTGGRSII